MTPTVNAALSRSVQPLILETGVEDYPYEIVATCFLVGFGDRAFAVTTRHSARPASRSPACIIPADGVRAFLPLKNILHIPVELLDHDYADISAFEVDLQSPDISRLNAHVLDIVALAESAARISPPHEAMLIGFPQQRSFADSDQFLIHVERVNLFGRIKTSSGYIRTLQVESPHGLDSFSGLSGSPIFSMTRDPDGREVDPGFFGMAIQGTASSGLVHFVEASVVIDFLSAHVVV